MFPKLIDFELFGRTVVIGSYGVMVALGYGVAAVVAYRQARTAKIPGDDMLDLLFWVLLSSVIGSRVLYVILNISSFSERPLAILAFWQGGLVFYGGLIAALITGAVVVWRKRMGYLRAADAIAPALALGHAFGRLGCFGVGCCWGKITSVAWGARFAAGSVAYGDLVRLNRLSAAASSTVALHPVQLYEAAGEALIGMMLLYVAARKRFLGCVILVYLIAYGSLRFVTEIFRGDPTRKYLLEVSLPWLEKGLGLHGPTAPFLSTSQFVSLLLVPTAAFTLCWLSRRPKRSQNKAISD